MTLLVSFLSTYQQTSNVLQKMVHYDETFIDYSPADMYSRVPYAASPAATGMLNMTATATVVPSCSTYDTAQYQNATPTADYTNCYYDPAYRSATYYQQGKEDLSGYQPNWIPHYQTAEMENYKQEYYSAHPTVGGGHLTQQSTGVGVVGYAPCTMISQQQHQVVEEEMAKDRRTHGLSGWVTGAVSNNCEFGKYIIHITLYYIHYYVIIHIILVFSLRIFSDDLMNPAFAKLIRRQKKNWPQFILTY